MRKIVVIVMLSLAVLLAPPVSVSARAGGATGGHVSTGTRSTGSPSMYAGRRMIMGRRSFYGFGPGGLIALGFIGWQVVKMVRRRQAEAGPSTADTYPIDDVLAKDFEPLFYAVEDAWSKQDVEALYPLMTAKYYERQQAILAKWAQAGKVNRLDAVALVDTAQEPSDPDHPHVVVTAQARDYFEYQDQPDAYNQQLKDDAMIQRFTEVWELAYAEDGHLLVANIRQ